VIAPVDVAAVGMWTTRPRCPSEAACPRPTAAPAPPRKALALSVHDHVLAAVGHALIEAGYRVLYARTTELVQRLQAARRDLALEAALAKLDKFHLVILDDITYAQKDQAESSVLFELIARRYETKSLAVAANQPFSAWKRVFPDEAMAVAAIDRLVHHATILEMNVDSYRRRAAEGRAGKAAAAATTTTDNPTDNHEGAQQTA